MRLESERSHYSPSVTRLEIQDPRLKIVIDEQKMEESDMEPDTVEWEDSDSSESEEHASPIEVLEERIRELVVVSNRVEGLEGRILELEEEDNQIKILEGRILELEEELKQMSTETTRSIRQHVELTENYRNLISVLNETVADFCERSQQFSATLAEVGRVLQCENVESDI